MRHTTWCFGVAALALSAAEARAQERPPRRQAPIEIRGTVPTPQVVTVRPREIPAYSRKVLVPNFYDHDFWPSILPAYEMVPQRTLTGEVALDTTIRRDTTAAGVPMMLRQDSLTVRRDSLGRIIPPPARIDSMRVRPDSMRAIPPVTPPPTIPPRDSRSDAANHAASRSGMAPAPSTRR